MGRGLITRSNGKECLGDLSLYLFLFTWPVQSWRQLCSGQSVSSLHPSGRDIRRPVNGRNVDQKRVVLQVSSRAVFGLGLIQMLRPTKIIRKPDVKLEGMLISIKQRNIENDSQMIHVLRIDDNE